MRNGTGWIVATFLAGALLGVMTAGGIGHYQYLRVIESIKDLAGEVSKSREVMTGHDGDIRRNKEDIADLKANH